MKSQFFSILFVVLGLVATSTNALSLILQSQEPYCFLVDSKRGQEVRVNYMVSGLNEEQVEFKVRQSLIAEV